MIYDYYKEKNKKNLYPKIIAIITAVVLVILASFGIGVYLEILQLDEIGGYSGVYLTNLVTKAGAFAAAFLLIFIMIALTNIFVKRNMDSYIKQAPAIPFKIPNYLFAFVFAVLGGITASGALSQNVLMYLYGVPFESSDPIFGQNIGYYLFQRPFLMNSFSFLSGFWFLAMLYTIGYYAIHFIMYYQNFQINYLKDKKIIIHNIINVAVFFFIKAVSYKFTKETILYSTVGNVNGAGYTDVNVWLPFYNIIPYVIIVIVAAAIFFILKGKLKAAIISVAVYPAMWILTNIIAMAVQGVVVAPNEFLIEKPYLKYDIEKTREAYGLDKITRSAFDVKQNLNADAIRSNVDIINNIRVIDIPSTLRSNNQLQSIRTFFRFFDGDIINYRINGKEMPVFTSAREISKDRLTDATYINTKFKYTHGFGMTMIPVNSFTSEGQVDYIVKDMPEITTDPSVRTQEPRIYYGELTNDYVFVNAKEINEIDGDNTESRYDGKGGIQLNGIKRLLFASKYSDFNMLISGYITPESKILINRNIKSRAQRAAPFLRIDNDAYMIVTKDGRLKWVLDAYTTSNAYPYSQNFENFNYIRNSVKIVVDAYDGTTDFYLIDPNDPIAVTYSRMYPSLFSKNSLPEDIKTHMRYPEFLFNVQTQMMKRYHIDPVGDTAVEAFYNNQDVWDIAKYQGGQIKGEKKEIEPFYNMIRLPGELNKGEELILMRPFSPANKENMVSWLAVRNSFDDYGRLVLFEFPKTKTVFGPNQVENQINQHPEISRDISLWNQGNKRAYMGNLLVIPIGDSLIYVEPIYIETTNEASIPQIREMVVAYQSENNLKITYGLTLQEALNKQFAGANLGQPAAPAAPATPVPGVTVPPAAPGTVPATPGTTPGNQPAVPGAIPEELRSLINRAVTTYDEAKKHSQSGDWENFGKKMKELDAIMAEINGKR